MRGLAPSRLRRVPPLALSGLFFYEKLGRSLRDCIAPPTFGARRYLVELLYFLGFIGPACLGQQVLLASAQAWLRHRL